MKRLYATVKVCVLLLMIFRIYVDGASKDPLKASPCSVVKNAVEEQKRNFDTLIVVARVSDIPGTFAENDAYDYVYIMKYKIIMVLKGSSEDKEILVGHYNPLIPRKLIKDKMDVWCDGTVEKFTVGEKHRLVLLKPFEKIWTAPLENEFVDSGLELNFAVKADIIK